MEPPRHSLHRIAPPVDWVWSQNYNRRHLTDDQRAMVVLEYKEYVAAEAKKRQMEGVVNLKKGDKSPVLVKAPKPGHSKPVHTRHVLADKADVSENKIRVAQKVKQLDPAI